MYKMLLVVQGHATHNHIGAVVAWHSSFGGEEIQLPSGHHCQMPEHYLRHGLVGQWVVGHSDPLTDGAVVTFRCRNMLIPGCVVLQYTKLRYIQSSLIRDSPSHTGPSHTGLGTHTREWYPDRCASQGILIKMRLWAHGTGCDCVPQHT